MSSFISPQVTFKVNFHELIVSNDLKALAEELTRRPYLIDQNLINDEETLLLRACIEKKMRVVKFLLSRGADPNIPCAKFDNETGEWCY